MPTGLLINEGTRPLYAAAGTGVCRSAGSGSDFSGGATNGYELTTDGAASGLRVTSPSGANTNLNIYQSDVTNTGRQLFIMYADWLAGVPSTTYSSHSIIFRADLDGSFAGNYPQRTQAIGPEWQAVMLGRDVNSSANVGHASWGVGAGTPVWSTKKRYNRFTINATAGTTNKVWLVDMRENVFGRSQIVLSLDDAHESVYDIFYPELERLGLKHVVPIISDNVGDASYCTEAELLTMYASGLMMPANHTKSHIQGNYGDSRTVWDEQWGACHDYIESVFGIAPKEAYSPYGEYLCVGGANSRDACHALYDISWGTIDGNLSPVLPSGRFLPRMNVKTFSGGINMAGHLARLESVIGSGQSVNLMLHQATDGAVGSDIQLTRADAYSLLNAVARARDAGRCDVVWGHEYCYNAAMGTKVFAA